MDQEQSLAKWARTVEFPQPLRWGDVEAAILSRPPPDVELPRRGAPSALRIAGAAAPLAVLLAAVVYGSSLIGLAVLLASRNGLVQATELWVLGVHLAFFAAIALPVTTLFIWADTGRRRSWKDLIVIGANALLSLVAWLVLRSSPEVFRSPMLQVLTLAAAALSLVALVVLVVASRSWRQRTPRRDRPTDTREHALYNIARAQVLESLVKRGVVDAKDIDIPDMLDMPLGSWRELDNPR